MTKRSINVVFIIVFLGISLIITIPIFTLSDGLSNYGTIDEFLTFEYAPDNSSPIEKLNLNVDVGNVNITYVTTPVDYYAKIQLYIEMIGQLVAGKKYLDYFNIVWDITSPSPTFTMLFKSDAWFDPSLRLTQNVTIIITLNANILFDINITINEKGNVHLLLPYAVPINNIDVYTNKGNILYDFQYCTLEGNITGIVNDGDIELRTSNSRYTRNSVWTLITELGNILVDIIQYIDLGANVTGKILISTKGDLHFFYKDNKPSVGALFILLRKTLAGGIPTVDLFGDNTIGFERSFLPGGRGNVYTSSDFPAPNCYNFTLESSGSYYGGAISD